MYSIQSWKYLALLTEQHSLLQVGMKHVLGEISNIIQVKSGDVV